ncbi:MAG: phosphoribosylformimino-5-aminoimidazole carboxamide ribotide isomerase [Pseudomonadales bacterium]|jgi:phosphoribosylformimino-5-aminoimidazole carboxamide ribotide isomerase|nr:phosphoribosylformimino-5-aminoimidazole carboxamide ribotide isomerase [Pseudomonadales bacterium]
MRFRPCIDLHHGKVVQIVGGSLDERSAASLRTNFVSTRAPDDYARLYRDAQLPGGHVISLGGGNQSAALAALCAWPLGMQYGGGVNPDNAPHYLDAGASHVIVTSYVFSAGRIDADRLAQLVKRVGRERLVLDLSCRKREGRYYVVTDRWQTFTEQEVNAALLERLGDNCAEFLVHGVDVEGLKQGIEEELIVLLGEHSPLPVTYAGGVSRLADLDRVQGLGQGRVDLTIGSALDIFGGTVAFAEVLAWQAQQQ